MISYYNKTWENSHPAERIKTPFVSTKENFINSQRGLRWLGNQEALNKGRPYVCDGEYIYQDLKEFEKFEGSKILVLGSGPTAAWSQWHEKDYDYIFTVNNFYKSDILKNTKIDIAFAAGGKVDTFDENYINYFKNNDTLIAIENVENRKHLSNIQKNFPSQHFLCSCRVQLKSLGAAPKMIVFAFCLGARQVDCAGIDGVPKDFHHKKTPVNNSFDKNAKWGSKYPHELHVEHFRVFDYYLKETFPDQVVNNLGAGHPYNCWSKI
jgi:hypothetical protein